MSSWGVSHHRAFPSKRVYCHRLFSITGRHCWLNVLSWELREQPQNLSPQGTASCSSSHLIVKEWKPGGSEWLSPFQPNTEGQNQSLYLHPDSLADMLSRRCWLNDKGSCRRGQMGQEQALLVCEGAMWRAKDGRQGCLSTRLGIEKSPRVPCGNRCSLNLRGKLTVT